jgi:hypothetical protein
MKCLYCGKEAGFKKSAGIITSIEKKYCDDICMSKYINKKKNKTHIKSNDTLVFYYEIKDIAIQLEKSREELESSRKEAEKLLFFDYKID